MSTIAIVNNTKDSITVVVSGNSPPCWGYYSVTDQGLSIAHLDERRVESLTLREGHIDLLRQILEMGSSDGALIADRKVILYKSGEPNAHWELITPEPTPLLIYKKKEAPFYRNLNRSKRNW